MLSLEDCIGLCGLTDEEVAARELALRLVLRDFVLQHPRCDERHRTLLHHPDRRRSG